MMERTHDEKQQSASAGVNEAEAPSGRKPLIKCGELPLSNMRGCSGGGTLPVHSQKAMSGPPGRRWKLSGPKGRLGRIR